jgi:hypoxanthine phosphoribosyltransferase
MIASPRVRRAIARRPTSAKEKHHAHATRTARWEDVDRLVDVLIPQFRGEFDGMVVITRGGIIPGGLLSEALNIKHILIASVDFPAELEEDGPSASRAAGLVAWPQFIMFPDDSLVRGRRILVVDDVWGSGRTITAVKNRVMASGGLPELCVFHYNPQRRCLGRPSRITSARSQMREWSIRGKPGAAPTAFCLRVRNAANRGLATSTPHAFTPRGTANDRRGSSENGCRSHPGAA